MQSDDIARIVERQRTYFGTHATYDIAQRKAHLRALHAAVKAHEADIAAALKVDLGKSADESYTTETGLVLSEISYLLKHVSAWSRPHLRPTNLANAVATCRTICVPYGVTLVMSPWNYPVLLTLEPLAGALAAGNCCVVKPSAYSPATSAVLRQICEECFAPELVCVVEGGRAENAALLEQTWDYVFFTGSVSVGKLVMERAAAHLTPVTLELGGKSPCIVDATAKLETAASRIAWGKYLNCGQTCVAPDYVLVDERVHDEFVRLLCEKLRAMYGADALANPDYGRIVNEKHFTRVCGLIDADHVVYGGRADAETLRIEPTVLDGVGPECAAMGEEIFGPVLPIITYTTLDEAEAFICARPTPLALYIFTRDAATERRFVRHVPFGGGCVNDVVVHLATPHMGFGGMGASGMGSYHGAKSFATFSHEKSILKKWLWPDLPLRNQPYAPWKQRVIKLFLR